jgi:hypothetical protein
MGRLKYVLFMVLVLTFLPDVRANEAKTYSMKQSNTEIVSDKDHFDLIFVTGWLSQRDNFFHNLLSNKTKISASINGSGTYWDGDQLSNAWIVENTDIGRNLGRQWGVQNKILLKGIPADTANVNIVVKFSVYQEDRLKTIIGTVQGAEPIPGVGVEPYLTYAKLVDGVITSILGTDKTKYPFLMDSGLADPAVATQHGMNEHYLIAISSNKDNDSWLTSLDKSKLSYDESSKQLKYNNQTIDDHTYAVFLVKYADRPDVPALLYNSKAPWAVLALTNFYQALVPDLSNAADIKRYDSQYVKTLGDCVDLLKRELRFSSYDRATALYAFAERAKSMISSACTAKSIPSNECKTPNLDSYESGITTIFGIKHDTTKNAVADGAKSLNDKFLLQIQ